MKLTAIKQDYKDQPIKKISFMGELAVLAALNLCLVIAYCLS
tara:strand:+ start:97 stop:222 length:126 start_codon:yes stop_codon:yes gene_type:complete